MNTQACGGTSANASLQIVKLLVTNGDVVDLYALDVVGELAAKEVCHRPFHAARGAAGCQHITGAARAVRPPCPFHFFLQLVHEHAVQLLHIMLHERIVRVPTETLGELLRAHACVAVLQLVKDTLRRTEPWFKAKARGLRTRRQGNDDTCNASGMLFSGSSSIDVCM